MPARAEGRLGSADIFADCLVASVRRRRRERWEGADVWLGAVLGFCLNGLVDAVGEGDGGLWIYFLSYQSIDLAHMLSAELSSWNSYPSAKLAWPDFTALDFPWRICGSGSEKSLDTL